MLGITSRIAMDFSYLKRNINPFVDKMYSILAEVFSA